MARERSAVRWLVATLVAIASAAEILSAARYLSGPAPALDPGEWPALAGLLAAFAAGLAALGPDEELDGEPDGERGEGPAAQGRPDAPGWPGGAAAPRIC